jgi:hypothetical protein
MILKAMVAWYGDSRDLAAGAGHRFSKLAVLFATCLRCANNQQRAARRIIGTLYFRCSRRLD